MEKLSLYAFYTGSILLAIGFVLHVVHTTLLATGARVGVTVRRPALAGAGAGFGGSTSTVGLGDGGEGTDVLARLRGFGQGTAPGGIAQALTWAATVALGMFLVVRAIQVGRGPWGNMFEFSIAFAFGVLASYLYLQRRYPIRAIAFVPAGVALFLAAYAISLPTHGIDPLVPALNNPPLITIHVAMAVISYGIFATSFGAAVGYLLQGQRDRFAWLPSHKVLDEVAYRATIIGFPIFAALIVLGSWWAAIAWGRYWGWDPKETAALVTWLIYAAYLHARNQKGWAGRPSALILVVGFGAVLFTFFAGNLILNGLHSYSGL